MLEKIFGKKNSIKRSLIIDFIISIIIVLILSMIGFNVFIDNEAKNVLISLNSNKSSELLKISNRIIILIIINTIITSIIIMGIASKKMLNPLNKIAEATKKVASGDFNVKLETKRSDEIGQLTHDFNEMVTDLKSLEVLQKEFIDNVSHEIKTPISSIQGFAKLLENSDISVEDRIEYSQIIKEESNRLLRLSTNMLKLSKLQNQNKITKKDEINVAEQIRKAIALLEPKWNEKEIVFNVLLEEKYFLGDEELIFQIWVNLIDNAIKFSNKNGKIDIILEEKENFIRIEIKDYGKGMTEEEKKRIFTRFYQIDRSHSEEGCGLGLAIVKRIIDLSNGEIIVESFENKGTSFIVKLPIENHTQNILIN